MQTSCKDCVFNSAETRFSLAYVDCELGRYEKFAKRGQVSDTDVNLLKVLCTACRNTPTTKEEIKKQLQHAYSLIIVDRDEGDAFERIKVSLSERQTVNPKEIVVVFKSESNFANIANYLSNYVKGTKTKYFVKWLPDEEYENEMIDIAVKSITGLSYTLIKSGESLPQDSLEHLYEYIDVNLKQFAMIHPEISDITGLTIMRLFHNYVNGNFGNSVQNKVLEAIEAENTEKSKDMITTWRIIRSVNGSFESFMKNLGD